MENEFIRMETRRQTNNTFPVRITPLTLTNKHLFNKIRINRNRLPSQFFSNPRSMPELQIPLLRTPTLQRHKGQRRKIEQKGVDEEGLQERRGTKSLRDYKSSERTRKSREKDLNETNREQDELGITFSKLPMKRVQNNAKRLIQFEKAYFKRVSTEPYEQTQGLFQSQKKEEFNQTLRIGNLIQTQKGISIRKNNHPLATLREIMKQNQ